MNDKSNHEGIVVPIGIASETDTANSIHRLNAISIESATEISSPNLEVFNSIILQAIVEGTKTEEGKKIELVLIPWFEIIKWINQDPNNAYQISPRKWEEIIAGAYDQAGFDEVILTPSSKDYGRDVIAIKHGLGSVRIIDQVKAYKPGHLVTANDVRALMGVLQGDKSSKGFLSTTSDFAPTLHKDPLIKPFIPSKIELINGKKLFSRLEEIANKERR